MQTIRPRIKCLERHPRIREVIFYSVLECFSSWLDVRITTSQKNELHWCWSWTLLKPKASDCTRLEKVRNVNGLSGGLSLRNPKVSMTITLASITGNYKITDYFCIAFTEHNKYWLGRWLSRASLLQEWFSRNRRTRADELWSSEPVRTRRRKTTPDAHTIHNVWRWREEERWVGKTKIQNNSENAHGQRIKIFSGASRAEVERSHRVQQGSTNHCAKVDYVTKALD